MRFKEFIFNEQKEFLAQKIGDVLTSLQEIKEQAPNMGTNDISRFTTTITANIRSIIRGNWGQEEKKYLIKIRNIGIYLSKSLEEKQDIVQALSDASGALEQIVSELGQPINKFAASDSPPKKDVEQTTKPIENKPPPDQSKPPQNAQEIEKLNQPTNPADTGLDQYSPSLGGNSGPLDAF